jgi:glycosyltransferase involved in cell wall biosynthesis
MLSADRILFMGLGKSAVFWYRCALPAINLNADWVGVVGEPPTLHVVTGLVKGDTVLPNYADYDVVIIQQPSGLKWVDQIHALQARGIKVLFECDDYLHGVAKQATHDYAKYYNKAQLAKFEMCMRACDGLIASTEYIARRYSKFSKRTFVCKNGIDMARYNLTIPERSTVNVVWAGATGHVQTLLPWLDELLRIMRAYDNVCFVSIGQPGLAVPFQQELGESRAIGVPFTTLEAYPAAMTLGDIALAPGSTTSWMRGKSELRFFEAASLGIPLIANSGVYPSIEHDVTGYHANTPSEAATCLRYLIENESERKRLGAAAKKYVRENHHIRVAALQWYEVCSAVCGGYESMTEVR